MTLRPAYVRLTLRTGESRPGVPCHLDCLVGAARPATVLDRGGRLDRALGGGGRFRARAVFHARRSLGRLGQQASRWWDDEEALGLSRTYLVEIADPVRTPFVVDALRDLRVVEHAGVERLARSYRAPATTAPGRAPTGDEALAPYDAVGSGAALGVEPGDPAVRVAVVDTGVALDHPELAGRLVGGYDLVDLGIGPLSGGLTLLGDSSGRDDVPADDVGHGTHVAGIVAARGRRVPRGVAGDCEAIPVRVLAGARSGPAGRPFGIGSLSDIDAGLKLAVDRGAAVLNLSLGTPATDLDPHDPHAPRPHAEVCRYAEEREVVLVAASGNDGTDGTDVPFYPAALPTVLAVGSVGADGAVSAFTSRGPHVVLHAPGEDVVGLGLHGYRRSSGTSHAAPFVSGAAALVISRARRGGVEPRAADVRRVLLSTARPRAPGGPPVLDARAALEATTSSRSGARSTAAAPSQVDHHPLSLPLRSTS